MELTIERMIYGGDGLARIPGEATHGGRGKAVFVPFVLPGEVVQARIAEEKSGFARGTLESLRTRSPQRIEPACPYFFRCGGCHYQHVDYAEQVRLKREVLRETLRRTGGIELESDLQTHAAEPWGYRNRTRLHVRHEPDFALGYYRFRSHRLLPIEVCPISAPVINAAIEAILSLGTAGGFPPWIQETEIFTDAAEKTGLIGLYCARGSGGPDRAAGLKKIAEELEKSFPNLAGVAALETESGEPILSEAHGVSSLSCETGFGSFRVSAGSFFQVNRFLLDEMVRLATAEQRGTRALDLYAGVGLFSMALAGQYEEVWAVETAQSSFADLEHNLHDRTNVHAVHSTVEAFLKEPRPADYAIADPPRNGLGPDVCRALAQMGIPRLCYVSCDPATLARDLKSLLASGYRISEVHLIDMFPQTFHIESIVHLAR